MIWDSVEQSEPAHSRDCKDRSVWVVWVDDDVDWNDLSWSSDKECGKLVKIDNCPLIYEDDVEVVVDLHSSHRTIRKHSGGVWQTRFSALLAASRKVSELRKEGKKVRFKST